MKKNLHYLFVAAFALSSLVLVSCSDDDESGSGVGNGGNDPYILYIDDEPTYASAYGSFLDGECVTEGLTTYPAFGVSNSGFKVETECSSRVFTPSAYLEYLSSTEWNLLGDIQLADITFYIEGFNPETAVKGQEVSFIEGAFSDGELSVRKYEKTTNPTYVPQTYFSKIKSGKITFESYGSYTEGARVKGLIAYRFDNVTVAYSKDVNGVENPQSEIKLDGLILTKFEVYTEE